MGLTGQLSEDYSQNASLWQTRTESRVKKELCLKSFNDHYLSVALSGFVLFVECGSLISQCKI